MSLQTGKIKQPGNKIKKLGNKIKQFGNKIKQFGNKIKQFGNKIKQFGNKIKKLGKRVKTVRKGFWARKQYIRYTECCPIEENKILLESQQGKSVGGNIMALAIELGTNEAFRDFKVYLVCKKKDMASRKKLLQEYGLTGVHLLIHASAGYYHCLATAKYLINDNTFTVIFFKRPGQVYLNTWHGTPLKTLGKKMQKDYGTIGNAQRNLFQADYLLFPNEFTMEHMAEDYMLNHFGTSQVILTGYPRNAVFLKQKNRDALRRRLGIEKKQVIAYLPTWRGIVANVTGKEQNARLLAYFREWEGMLQEHQLVYVKLHPISRAAIDLSEFHHICPFPEEFDSYEVLNATDLLVTDYSSVFFDYAVSRRKIVLFPYDRDEYTADRGFYFSMDELPFPQVTCVEELMREINSEKNYEDAAFLDTFCKYEGEGVTEAILRKLLFEQDSELLHMRSLSDNGKKNIFLYPGGLAQNGVTTSVLGLLANVDRTKYNYIIVFKTGEVRKRQEILKALPDGVAYMGFSHASSMNLPDTIKYQLWKEFRLFPYKKAKEALNRMAQRERLRIFGGCRVDHVIQFSGYGHEWTVLMEGMPCTKTIYVHNDMEQEIKTRGNADFHILRDAYQKYTSVAIVTPDLMEVTRKIAGCGNDANIVVVKNVINYKSIQQKAEEALVLDPGTTMNVEEQRLREVLDSSKTKFITIGRYSPEKGHKRLIKAFERVHREHPDTCLLLIGGHGVLYRQTQELVKQSSCPEDIILIRSMSNPYTVLKRCDCFVLPSLYEGFGLVLAEADILGLPCVSTDITGPGMFMRQYGGRLVENSEEGIYLGMSEYFRTTLPKSFHIDYEVYNREAVAQFEALLP